MGRDEREFSRRFDELYPSLVRFLWAFSGDREIARDVAQETFLRLYRAEGPGFEDEAVRFWVFRTARNLAINELESRGRRSRILALVSRFLPRAAPPDPEERRQRSERANSQWSLVRELPQHQRTCLLLREQEGMSYREIARVQGVSLSKVKVDIHRARTKLRERWTAMDSSSRQGRGAS